MDDFILQHIRHKVLFVDLRYRNYPTTRIADGLERTPNWIIDKHNHAISSFSYIFKRVYSSGTQLAMFKQSNDDYY